jgi:hypothetical protein
MRAINRPPLQGATSPGGQKLTLNLVGQVQVRLEQSPEEAMTRASLQVLSVDPKQVARGVDQQRHSERQVDLPRR